MRTYTFTATAEFEITGTVKAQDEADAEAKLNDMELAIYDSHYREANATLSQQKLADAVGLIHYPQTIGVYKEENHSFVVDELEDPRITDLHVAEEG